MTPEVLPNDIELEYLAEGAANIVYKIRSSISNTSEFPFKYKLLRLRKKLPTSTSVLATQTAYEAYIRPLFPSSYLLGQTIIALPPGLISQENDRLKALTRRPPPRAGDFLAPEAYGLLVDDMSPGPNVRLVEFKPKWLLQSPTAPKNAMRCRTCALRDRRNALHIKTAIPSKQPSGPPGYCPLYLISNSPSVVEKAARTILFPHTAHPLATEIVDDNQQQLCTRLSNFLQTTEILPLLRKYQQQFDSSGALFTSNEQARHLDLLMAYTLRDCSIFVLMSEADGTISAKIGDLDLKSGLKIPKWRSMERELIDEGWYTCDQPVDCAISSVTK